MRFDHELSESPGSAVTRATHRVSSIDLLSPFFGRLIDGAPKRIYILTVITWDETKRRENIRKHKIDVSELEPVFDNPMISVEDTRQSYGELRVQSLGFWQGRVVFLVWTPRGDDTAHIISCRYADRKETGDFFQAF